LHSAKAVPIEPKKAAPQSPVASPAASSLLQTSSDARTPQIPKSGQPYYRYQRASCQAVPRGRERKNRRWNEQAFRIRGGGRPARDQSLARST
jgi:hypothetical protein